MSDTSPPNANPSGAPASGSTSASALRRWGRRAAWTVGAMVVGLLLLIGTVLLALQTDSGATVAAQWGAGAANPLPNTTLTVEGASGSWLRSLELTGVRLTRTDAETGAPVTMARVDTLAARYHLWPLVRGRLHVSRVSVAGPEITMRQAADSTWDWARVLPDSESTEPDTSAAMPIRVDAVRVVRGAFAAAFYAEGRDSTARLRTLQVRARDLRSASAFTGRLDTLGLRGRLPGDTTDLRLAARGALSATTATLDTFQFDSPRSRVRGHGRVDLPSGPDETIDTVSVQLRADPFALRDLTFVAPTLDVDPRETVRLDVQMEGARRRLTASADAQFSGGGRITVRAAGTPTTTAPSGSLLHYRLDAEIRRLTSSLLGPPDSTRNRLNATLSADVEGPSLSALDGTADVRVTNTRSAGLQTPEITFASTLEDGAATLDLQGSLNGARLRASGRARPLGEAPSADVTATIEALNVAAFAPDGGVESDLTATTNLRGRALGTDRQTVDVTTTLDSSRVGVQRIVDGRLELILRPERARFDGGLSLPAGTVEAAGSAALDGTERFTLKTARLDDFNAAALVGDTTASRLTGTAQVEGRGFSPETARLDAELTLRDSFYGPHQLPSLSATATLEEGRFVSTTDATLNGGTWAFAVEGTPFAATPTVKLTRGRFRDLDVGPFLADTTQSSALHGTIRGAVRGTAPATMTADAGLTLDSSRVNRQRIDDVALDLRLRDGRLGTDLALDTPDGGVQLAATARPFDAVPTYRVTEGSFAALDAGALANLPGLSTALSGTLSLTGRGATPSTLALDADLSFADSYINDAALSRGHVRATSDTGRATLDGQLAVAGGTVDVSGSIDRLDATPAYTLQATVDSLDAAALAGRDSLNARLDSLRWTLDGRGTDPSTLRASTTGFVRGMQADSFTLDTLALAGTLRRGRLALDTVRAASNVFASTGSGTLALTDTAAASSFTLRTEVTNTEPIRRLVGAEAFQLQHGVVEATISGSSLATQQLDGTIEIERLTYNNLRLPQAEFTISGRRGREQMLGEVDLDGTLRSLSLPALSTDRIALQAVYDGTTVDLSTSVDLPSPYSATLGAAVTPGADQTDVTLSRLDLQLQDDQWSLSNEATLSVGDRYRIRDLQLQSGDQRIAADGVVDMSGRQDFGVTIEDMRLGPVAPLAGLDRVGGTLNGSLELNGVATAPQLDSRLTLDLRSEDRAVGTLDLDAAYEGLALDVDARMAHSDGSVLTATGTLPADLRLQAPDAVDVGARSVRLNLEADQFPLNWIDPFLDPATAQNVEGILATDVTVGGTLDAPALEGTAALSNGAARLSALGTRYHGAAASLRFAKNQIVLGDAVIRSENDGQFRVDGTISVPKLTVGEFDLELSASNFIAIDTRAVRRALVDGTMTLQGSVQEPVLGGSLKMNNAEIFYNELFAESGGAAAITLTDEDRLTLENQFGIRLAPADTTTSDAYEALEMDLSVRIQRDTWLRSRSSPEMDLEFEGDFDLDKAQSDDLQVFGSVQAVTRRSTLRQFGQEFQITDGTLTFNGDPTAPRIVLEAVYEQRARGNQESEVSITLNLTGRPGELTPTLASDPPMATRNILSYLATGRPADELGSGGGGSGNMATQMALGQAADVVENIAARELGLDVVRVQIRPSGLSYLTVGRYLTPGLFASIQQPVTNAASATEQMSQYLPDLTLEYQLTDTLMLRTLKNQRSLQLNFLYEYAY